MYNLPEYKEKDPEKIWSFMQANPFVLLCCVTGAGTPVATHVPVLLRRDENGGSYLLGHIMKGTDHYKALLDNTNVLAIFTGPHTYVSASWYTDKQVGSTWNYMSVHAHGQLSFLGHDDLIDILRDTTLHFENNPESPSLFEHLPGDYVNRLTKAIAGFRIDINDLQHVFKLSQNRDEKSYVNIIDRLENGDQHARQVAAEMQVRHAEQYPPR
jgi:transcriptional regulator